jgi:hypothetical protein
MELYKEKDLDTFNDKWDKIEAELVEEENTKLWPTYKDRKAAEQIVYNFIKEHKRKLYGGTAQNMLIKVKNKEDAFYPDTDIADLDFYSPEPIEDLHRLANIFHSKGYKYVEGKEPQHKETYSVFVNFINVADISYVPKNIYHRMPFIDINGINYVHPNFIYIDLYRMFTDPLNSGTHRWKKTFPRLYKLQKYYPINKATAKLPTISKKSISSKHRDVLDRIFEYLKNRKTVILFGRYAYNCFLEESKIMKDSNLGKKYQFIDAHCYEFISTRYREDGIELYNLLKKEFSDVSEKFSIVEYYPFWSLFGYSAKITFEGETVAHIYHYNYRCLPIREITAAKFSEGSIKQFPKDTIQISSFALTLLYNFISTQYARVNKEEESYQFHNIMTSHIVEMRNFFNEKNHKTIFDKSVFQEFITSCIGEAKDIKIETMLERNLKKKQGKLVIFSYRPENGVQDAKTTYKFPNSSGNPIRNVHNLRILSDDTQGKPRSRPIDEPDNTEPIEDEIPEDILNSSELSSDSSTKI